MKNQEDVDNIHSMKDSQAPAKVLDHKYGQICVNLMYRNYHFNSHFLIILAEFQLYAETFIST